MCLYEELNFDHITIIQHEEQYFRKTVISVRKIEFKTILRVTLLETHKIEFSKLQS